MRYGIIGTGAVGGYIAAKLQMNGHEVHCQARSNYEAIKENGLLIEEKDHKERVNLSVYDNYKDMPECDVVLMCTKSNTNHSIFPHLYKLLTPKGIVILVQNGIGFESDIESALGFNRTAGAVVSLKLTQLAPNHIKHHTFTNIKMAAFDSRKKVIQVPEVLKSVIADFDGIGFDASAYENLLTIRWEKLAINIPSSGLCIVLNSDSNAIFADNHSFELIKEIIREVVAAANKTGAKVSLEERLMRVESYRALMKRFKGEVNPSMKDDFDQGKRLELDAIYKHPLEMGARKDFKMPLTEMLYHQVIFQVNKNKHKW